MLSQLSKAVIPKQIVPVILHTAEHRIEGMMHCLYNYRVSDMMNAIQENFIPITSARVYSLATNALIAEHEFIAINKQHIIFLYEHGKRWEKPEEPREG